MRNNKIFWLPGIIQKIFILLFLLSSIVFLTFVIGNFQGFLDSTQLILINIFELIAVVFVFVGIYHLIFTIIGIIQLKSKEYITLGLTILGELFIISVYILVKMIDIVTQSVN